MKKFIGVIVFTAMTMLSPMSFSQSACIASFNFQQDGTSLQFHDASTSHNSINSWSWDFGDDSYSHEQNPVHVYSIGQTYNVCLTIHDVHGCISTFCHHIILQRGHECVAAFSFNSDSTGTNVQFTNTSIGLLSTTSYLWEFGDSSTSKSKNPEHVYNMPGIDVVCLIVTDSITGCSAHTCHSVDHSAHHSVHHSANVGLEYPTNESVDLNTNQITLLPNSAISGTSKYDDEDLHVSIAPNSTTGICTIYYTLSQESSVRIVVYDVLGKGLFDTLYMNEDEGEHSHLLCNNEVRSGAYIVLLQTNSTKAFTKYYVQK